MSDSNAPDGQDIVIIGASHGGVQLAVSLREAGFSGAITLVSNEAHTPYHRPPLSKTFMKDAKAEAQILRAKEYYSDHNIELLKRRSATTLDVENATVELDDGSALCYSRLCLATGARPRLLDIAGIGSRGVYQLRDLDDARNLRDAATTGKKAVIAGGGFIGLEVAATLKGLGIEVTLVEATSRLMGRSVAPQISQYVLERYRQAGIEVLLDTSISQIEAKGGAVTGAICGDSHFPADMVLMGIGAKPNDQLAKAAGLETGNGIEVDANFMTSADNIYAIGDVASYEHWLVGRRVRLESVQNATDQAKNLAGTLIGEPQDYRAVPWFWSHQGEMKIQMAGLSHNSKSVVTRDNPARNSLSAFHYDDQDKLIAIDTINCAWRPHGWSKTNCRSNFAKF